MALKIQTNYKHAVAEVEVVESCLLAEDLPQAAERRKAWDDFLPEAPTQVDNHVFKVGRSHSEMLQDEDKNS